MALVASAAPAIRKSWVTNQDDDHLINVFLRMWDGKTLCCTINTYEAAITSIASLEQRVLQQYPSNDKRDFYFVVQGKPLDRQNCHSSMMMLNNGNTIFVQYRNRGGCFMVSLTVLGIIMTAIIGSTCTCGLSLLVVPLLLPLLFVLPLFCL